jgi:hypothetical protein
LKVEDNRLRGPNVYVLCASHFSPRPNLVKQKMRWPA